MALITSTSTNKGDIHTESFKAAGSRIKWFDDLHHARPKTRNLLSAGYPKKWWMTCITFCFGSCQSKILKSSTSTRTNSLTTHTALEAREDPCPIVGVCHRDRCDLATPKSRPLHNAAGFLRSADSEGSNPATDTAGPCTDPRRAKVADDWVENESTGGRLHGERL